MMRSLYSGVSGLKTHQTRMDVIGNNIANVNTVSYKSMSVNFSDLMYQTTQSATGPNVDTGLGGTNPRQIGLGVQQASISTNISEEGASQSTGNPFDIKISGDSFFIVSDGSNNYFTRDGSFNVDANGNLVMSSNGYTVMGWKTEETDDGTLVIKKDTVSALNIMSSSNLTYPAEATKAATASGIVDWYDENQQQAAGKTLNLQIYDNLGYSYTVKFSLNNVSKPSTTGENYHFSLSLSNIVDSDGKTVKGFDTNSASCFTTVDLEFKGADGSIVSPTIAANTVLDLTSLGDAFSKIEVDFTGLSVSDNDGKSTVSLSKGNSAGGKTGRSLGSLSSIAIQTDGQIYASYTNGQKKLLGQIAVADFANAAGLQKEGSNLYSATNNSGDFDGIGTDITSAGGSMATGVLEMSNVDLSSQFTDMITTQRGFQANSRIITVSDTLLEELINLKR